MQRILNASVTSKMQKSVYRKAWEVDIFLFFSGCQTKYTSVAYFKVLINFQELWNLLWKFSFQTTCYSRETSISKIFGVFC